MGFIHFNVFTNVFQISNCICKIACQCNIRFYTQSQILSKSHEENTKNLIVRKERFRLLRCGNRTTHRYKQIGQGIFFVRMTRFQICNFTERNLKLYYLSSCFRNSPIFQFTLAGNFWVPQFSKMSELCFETTWDPIYCSYTTKCPSKANCEIGCKSALKIVAFFLPLGYKIATLHGALVQPISQCVTRLK